MSSVEVIINAAAGAGAQNGVARAVEEAFAACGVEARLTVAREGAELSEMARRAVSNGARAVVAGGGDGTVGAVASALSVLRRYPFMSVRLNADGQEIARKTPFVLVGNNEYRMETLQIGARECLDAGCLSLYVAHNTGRLGLLVFAVRALFGRLRQSKDFDALRAQEIWVETRRPKRLPVATDGEVNVMTTPLHYRILPGALRVIVQRGDGKKEGRGDGVTG